MGRSAGDSVVVFIGLIALLFMSFYAWESGDMNTVMFGTILYVPYVLALTVYNAIAQAGTRLLSRSSFAIIALPLVPLVLWMILSGGTVVVRYFKLDNLEMSVLIGVLGILNLLNYLRERKGDT